jgi:ATP-dependent Clp protease ATP-binding subunit ClpC
MNQDTDIEQTRLDSDLYRVLLTSKRICISEGVGTIFAEAIALSIISAGPNLVTQILAVLEADIERLHKKLRDIMKRRCSMESSVSSDYTNLIIGDDTRAILKRAEKISSEMGDVGLGVQHVLLSIISSHKVIKEVFVSEGVGVEPLKEAFGRLAKTVVRKRTAKPMPGSLVNSNQPTSSPSSQQKKTPQGGKQEGKPNVSIESYCKELVAEAAAGKLTPVIGREEEIDRVISILCRMTKNNPLLVGDAGVGKTAVVEGVAQRIACGAVPACMKNRKIWYLDMSDFVAGTQFRGQFEERMKNLKEVFRENKEYILFVDEVHSMLGAGGAMGSLDAGNILKPALARGELRCIGATTEDEAKKYLSKDSALNRRFQKVFVKEPTQEETLKILHGLKDVFEKHHKCTISDDAMSAAVEYSGRYITERKYPDKAIDCIDEMCSTYFVHSKDVQGKVMTRDDAASAVAKQSGVSKEMVLNNDIKKAVMVEKNLMDKVIGQDSAVKAVSRSLKRAYSGVRDPQRPIAVLFFGGQSGTGKTYIGELLNQELFGNPDSLIRINMTEFTEKHTVSRLVGSPPGYVGYGETNQLTDRVLRKPYSLLLIDEMEKAHPDVVKLFFQIFSKGMLTDAEGRSVNFKNTVIIITSNLGSNHSSAKALGFLSEGRNGDYVAVKTNLVEECKKLFGTPFVNRVDEFVPFGNLTKEDLYKIVNLRMKDLVARVANKKVKLTYDDNVAKSIVDGLEEGHGVNANAISSSIAQNIESVLSEEMSNLDNNSNGSIHISLDKESNILAKKKAIKVKK